MTAPSDPNTAPTVEPNEAPRGIPSAIGILRLAFVLTKRYASDLYGFAAYLLFPLILTFGVQGVTGTIGEVLTSVVNVLMILLMCWIQATTIVLIRMRLGHPKKDPDPRSIGMYATTILGTFTFTMLLSGFLQLAGYLCFVVPGIILSVLLTFAPEEVALHGCGPLSALAASRKKVQPHFLQSRGDSSPSSSRPLERIFFSRRS